MTVVNKRYAHINHASGSAHNLLDAEAAYVTGSLTVEGAAGAVHQVSGSLYMRDNLVVAQQITGSALKVSAKSHLVGDVQLDNKLDMGDTAALRAMPAPVPLQAAIEGALGVGGMLGVLGDFSFAASGSVGGDFQVDGVAEFQQAVTMQSTLAAGDSTFKNVYAKDNTSDIGTDVAPFHAVYASELHAQTLSASLHLYSQGDLAVQEAATFQSSITVGGAANLNDVLEVKGITKLDAALEVTGSATLKDDLDAAGGKLVAAKLGDVTVKGADLYVKNSSGTEKFKVAAASGDTHVQGTFIGEQQATLKGAGYGLVVDNSASFGAVRVYGDLVVDGDQVILNTNVLEVEDYQITLVSGSHTDSIASGAGLKIQGDSAHTFAWRYNEANQIDATTLDGANAFVINDNWLPSADNKFFLGKPSHAWKGLYLSGDATVGGDLAMNSGDITGVDNVSAVSLDLTGDLTATAGTASFGVLEAGASTLASATVTNQLEAGSLIVDANASVTGDLTVTGSSILADASFSGLATFNAGAEVAGSTLTIASDASLVVHGSATYDNFTATGYVHAAHLSASAGAEVTGSLDVIGAISASLGVTAASFTAAGLADVGSLMVGGINMSPIATNPEPNAILTNNTNSHLAELFSVAIADGEMMKLELEVQARGRDAAKAHAATWKVSIAAMRTGATIDVAAIELSKEVFGSGAALDVQIEDVSGAVKISAKGSASVGGVYWDAQIVKKMVMDSAGKRTY